MPTDCIVVLFFGEHLKQLHVKRFSNILDQSFSNRQLFQLLTILREIMRKDRYYIANFPPCSMKSSLATLSRNILRNTDNILRMFIVYADESCGQSPRRILQNMAQNNETVFVPYACYVETSREGQPSQEQSSSVKVESSSSSPRKQFPFVDKPEEASEPANIETETAADCQELIKSCEKAETLRNSAEDDPQIFTTEELEKELKSKEPKATAKSPQNIKDLIKENSAQIKSISIIRQLEEIGVEIDIDLLTKTDKNSSEKLEQGSTSFGETKSSGSVEKKSNSPSSRDSKPPGRPSVHCELSPTIDYSDPTILEFLAERLFSILSCRKKYMKQIYNCFLKFKKDVNAFSNTIKNLKFVVELLPMVKENYSSKYLVNLRSELINESTKILAQVESLRNDVDSDIIVWEKCIEQIDSFDKKFGLLLSTKCQLILDFNELKRLESCIKEICAEADGTVILKDGRRDTLLKYSSDFECLIKNFVIFLIITEILKPPMIALSE